MLFRSTIIAMIFVTKKIVNVFAKLFMPFIPKLEVAEIKETTSEFSILNIYFILSFNCKCKSFFEYSDRFPRKKIRRMPFVIRLNLSSVVLFFRLYHSVVIEWLSIHFNLRLSTAFSGSFDVIADCFHCFIFIDYACKGKI